MNVLPEVLVQKSQLPRTITYSNKNKEMQVVQSSQLTTSPAFLLWRRKGRMVLYQGFSVGFTANRSDNRWQLYLNQCW